MLSNAFWSHFVIGTDRTEYLDNRLFHGNAFDLLGRAERFFRLADVRSVLPVDFGHCILERGGQPNG